MGESFWGIFLGIVAGSIVQLIVEFAKKRIKEKDLMNNLKFEMQYNLKNIDSYLEELSKYRNEVNADLMYRYFGYYQLSKCLFYTFNQLLDSGLLYKRFSTDQVNQLWGVSRDFNAGTEQFVNDQVKWNRENYNVNGIKQKAIDDINFFEEKYKEDKVILESILKEI